MVSVTRTSLSDVWQHLYSDMGYLVRSLSGRVLQCRGLLGAITLMPCLTMTWATWCDHSHAVSYSDMGYLVRSLSGRVLQCRELLGAITLRPCLTVS